MHKRKVVLVFGSIHGTHNDIDENVARSVMDYEKRGWEVVSATTSMAASRQGGLRMEYCTTIVFEKMDDK